MGQKSDGEIIFLDDITQAQALPSQDSVLHLLPAADEPQSAAYFCRFAIRDRSDANAACITPLNSGLLSRQDRWKRPRYAPSKPIVIDLSSRDLGLAEGFSQAEFDIIAGLEFDSEQDMSWRTRYPTATIYDESPPSVLSHMRRGKLLPPQDVKAGVPKVLIFSETGPLVIGGGEDPDFDLPLLNIINELNASEDDFDCLVSIQPAGILHPRYLPSFAKAVLELLKKRHSVHVFSVRLPDHGISNSQTYIVLLASPICSDVPWPATHLDTKSIEEQIGHLKSKNPRADDTHPTAGKHVFLNPAGQVNVYNHGTGQLPDAADRPYFKTVDFESNIILPTLYSDHGWLHPTRHDILTIIASFPPPIARGIAEAIRKIIKEHTAPGLDASTFAALNLGGRPQKRTRVD
ncbi:uncharacterized protein BO95DRAFT_515279 [Aspergillus brunneoviolaceus CBS 621.78]|uniref:Uncharacterized protein n=1 Tax=Aspergillus brunneoviolaceus CBS 621.78 TaxID=1450534 RepID=A0ACD1G5U5_9EURO|nr:hypothetical protein BO95DRAFT_515279 [Aspergillus brunneoviolaceus CBS 621.78]RAH44669.1 hypothetical protein BO95DRAFT_515279 [Aspergillus brunneoviolaceus CBS 621.78]